MWIKSSIAIIIKEGDIIEKDVVHLSMPPTFEAKSCWIMLAFGNHIVFQVLKNTWQHKTMVLLQQFLNKNVCQDQMTEDQWLQN